MAARKTLNFLPIVFQTDTNNKFLSATLDQLVTEPNLTSLYGYIGRKFAPTFKNGDSYVAEHTALRQNYQLEPSVIIKNKQGEVTFFASYIDFLNKLKYYGGYINNQSRLFSSEYYTFDPHISYDKFVNFSQYYWLPNGPDAVVVESTGIELDVTYSVTRDVNTGKYIFTNKGVVDNSITLARGGTYSFVVNQPGVPFWIQSELGTSGVVVATPTISSRNILGVTNNGTDVGTVTFVVPQSTAQDRFSQMQTVFNVDYAVPVPFSELHNHTLTQFLAVYPQFSGITGSLNGKYVVFVNQDQLNNLGEEIWTVPPVHGDAVASITLNTLVTANLGDTITQTTTTVDITLSNKVTVAVGDIITQTSSGANIVVTQSSVNSNSITGVYNSVNQFSTTGSSISINGVGGLVKPTAVGAPVITKATATVYASIINKNVVYVTYADSNKFNIFSGNMAINDAVLNATPTAVANGVDLPGFDAGNLIPDTQRFGVWKVQFIDAGIGEPVIRLVFTQDVALNQKVYIRYGISNANKEYYKDYDGFLKQMPLLTSILERLWIQDGAEATIYSSIKIVEYDGWTIDVNADIIGQQNYTSPNNVEFTSGLKIQFSTDVTPAEYQNKQYYVEGVGSIGSGIRLIDVDHLVTPELYNDYNVLNYPNQVFPEYITINRSSIDQNPWGRNNRWFHRDVITVTAQYNNTSPIFDQTLRGQRPIVQFDSDLQLMNSGRVAKKPIDILDTLTVDAFNELEGKSVTDSIASCNLGIIDGTTFATEGEVQGTFVIGMELSGVGIAANTYIVGQNGDGSWVLSVNYDGAGNNPDPVGPSTVIGAIGTAISAFGVTLTDGLRVLFANDYDPLVRNKIYTIKLVQYRVDEQGNPSGSLYIKLLPADDSTPVLNDSVVVTKGVYKGSQWWYDGTQWIESQQKTQSQQEPLFDVFDSSGKSLSKYTKSTFAGTKLFGYLQSTVGVNDSVLGFPLSYRNFTTQGDIEFANYFNTDTFTYGIGQAVITGQVSSGFLQKIKDRYTTSAKNTWQTVVEPSKQYQLIGYVYDGTSNVFPIDVTPNVAASIPYLKVYKNFNHLTNKQWILINNQIRITLSQEFIGDGSIRVFSLNTAPTYGIAVLINGTPRKTAGLYTLSGSVVTFATAPAIGDVIDIRTIVNPAIGDQIDILVYSDQVSQIGYYQVPSNLDLNAQNIDISTLTLGQIRNHLVALGQNSTTVVGNIIGESNLRDVDIKAQGGTILQHSAPVPHAELFILDDQANFIDALRFAQREYSKFKNKFLDLAAGLQGIQPNDPAASVDLILTTINQAKNKSFPWHYSDMVPYGTLKNTLKYIIFDPFVTEYEITTLFNDQQLSNQAVLVYLNGRQLVKYVEYVFRTDRPAITILTGINVDEVITIDEYANTDGCYIPETPTKLGLWPKYYPEVFLDNTYRDPIYVIRGHDGSITPAFNDYRDALLYELELRIFNNIKIPDNATYQNIFAVIPGKFRKGDYSLTEITQLVSRSFQSWVGNNKIDFTKNDTFDSNDAFTWNYGEFNDRVDGERLPGSWRACYQYFYDTFRPHITPWEMLGFASQPEWWETYYGPAPYTGGNKLLWDDLEAGLIRAGIRSGGLDDNGNWIPIVDNHFSRAGLSQIIPVDENGQIKSPAEILTASFNSKSTASSWAVGQYGPVEFAWRSSSDFPFAVQQALALSKPGEFFGQLFDTYNISPYNALYDVVAQNQNIYGTEQYLSNSSNHHVKQNDLSFNGDVSSGTVYRGSGYINWIADYLTNQGINPGVKLNSMVKDYRVQLAYKVAGFTDQGYLNVLAEQNSPASTNDSIIIPNENYKIHLNKSTPVQTIVYSAVIVEKTTNGYSVRGYDVNNPYFTIIPSVVNSHAHKITVLNRTVTVFNDYQKIKVTVPYGYEFVSQQQLADFLISYERFLIGQGFIFNEADSDLTQTRNWTLSVKEFLYWAQQGWKPGSILVLSPVANTLNAISFNAITDGISDSQYGSKVLDQNFKLVKNTEYNVLRTPSTFKLSLTEVASVIGYVELDLVQYEHVLLFDNTTVFNDIIYKPELGNRQFRLKLIGQKTAAWDGSLSAPGFIYSSGAVTQWSQGKDYLQGDLIEYKNQYYTALQNITASVSFDFAKWKQIDKSQIQTGLLPNFSTLAAEGKSYYDSYPSIDNKKQIDYSHGLIGFRPRQYLSDLGLTETTQIEFYKGFIKQKGTANAVNQMLNAVFNNLTSEINFYEEWAIRVGEYGAVKSNPYVELPLDERAFSVNPSTAQFVGITNSSLGDGETVFNKSQLYKSTDQFNGNIALNRTTHSNYDSDIPTAGYVNIDDVDATIFDLANFSNLDNLIGQMGSGYRIWCAKDFTQNWNVYRITETNNQITTVSNSLNGYITFSTKKPHGFKTGSVFLVKEFDTDFNGFYQVYKVSDLYNVTVVFNGPTTTLSALSTKTGLGILFRLDSLRFKYMEDTRQYMPPNGWKIGEKVWIDDDAATTAVQGQPYDTPSGTWKVYEKHHPWNLSQELTRNPSVYTSADNFGTSVRMSPSGLISVIGAPLVGTGAVSVYLRGYEGSFSEAANVVPDGTNTLGFGSVVDLVTDSNGNDLLATGAPNSYGNIGFVYVSNKSSTITTFNTKQILTGGTADKFGTSLAFNQNGDWLYVGAPGNDKVYVYGVNKFVPFRQQTVSVNSTHILNLTGSISANVGDIISAPSLGTKAVVLAAVTNFSNVQVSSVYGFISANVLANVALNGTITVNVGDSITQASSGANISIHQSDVDTNRIYGYYNNTHRFDNTGNIFVNGVDASMQPTSSGSANVFINDTDTGVYANIMYTYTTNSNVRLSFAPEVANDANILLITSSTRTYIPGVDYTLDSANLLVKFNANIASSDITITQQPYYQFITSVTGNTGSQFGAALSSSFDGAQLAVGAPNDTVIGLPGAGSVWVYDRVIEAFNSTGLSDYTTTNTIPSVHKVTVDTIEVTNYFVVGTNTIRFINPPGLGHIIYIEVNHFVLLEKLIGVDSLTGGTSAIQANAAFGTSLTICSNNCAIYVGAPYYDNGTSYNTGAVWKFHNRGRLYGTNNGYASNPVFMPGDTIRLDNYEIEVQGRLMPTTAGNILTLSSAVIATVGQYITQSGSSANVKVVASTVSSGSQFITVDSSFSGASTAFNFGLGNVITVGSSVKTAYPMASLDSLVKDINDASLLGISAANENGSLRLNSNKTLAKNLLRILSGTNASGSLGVYQAADMRIFAFMQIIINPFQASGEYFGSRVKLASNAYMLLIGAGPGTTRNFTTIDSRLTTSTTFDADTTRFTNIIKGSGSSYIYELYDDPRNQVEHPGRYQYCQQIDPGNLASGDQFGYSIDIEGPYVIISAPGKDLYGVNTGTVYVFHNPTLTRGWNLIRYQQETVDVDSINRIYMYSNLTNTILDSLQFVDPVKGRILGQAEQEITYKTEYDPAIYNKGTNSAADINTNVFWGSAQVGKVWWNLSQVRYLNYEQDTLTYRSINWGQLFPGSNIEILEWVESDVLPSKYVTTGYDGTPKYADDSAYVEVIFVNPTTNIITSKYYFWVMDKTTVDPNDSTRLLPTQSIQNLIENPKGQGIAYAAIIRNDAISLYNIGNYLSAKNTILHIDYDLIVNTNIIHSEYELVQKGNPNDELPAKIVNKLIDSLSGIDVQGQVVPDPTLSIADRYGINIRPRQSMFIDRLTAVNELVAYVNSIFAVYPIAKEFDIAQLNTQEPLPNITTGIFDEGLGLYIAIRESVATESVLQYLNITDYSVGYKVLVENDTTQDGLWVIYQLTSAGTWEIYRVQAYKTSLYWSYTDWYDTGYDSSTKPTFNVETTIDALKLGAIPGDVIKISNATGNGTWQMVLVSLDGTFTTVGIQNGTIQINPNLGNFDTNNLGFDNQEFDTNRYDQNPNIEIRSIISALQTDIFVNTLNGKFNDLFFVMINYLFTEQKFVDWVFKSSFISVSHKLRTLSQFPSYIQDNQTYYQDYIDEVKPYRTKVREYLIDYTGEDVFLGSVTDFDLPSYYDTYTDNRIFRSPSGEAPYSSQDEMTWQTFPYNQWYNNRALTISEIVVDHPGLGYAIPPLVTILHSDGTPSGAMATSTIDANTGAVVRIDLINPDGGFVVTPTVVINGSCSVPAVATAILRNNKVRSFNTTLKFDRITYNSHVQNWAPYTSYNQGDIVTYAMLNGTEYIRRAYEVNQSFTSGANFVSADYTVYAASAFGNANDRIVGYYQPTTSMPSVDITSVSLVNANAAVNTDVIYVFNASDVFPGMYINGNGVTSSNVVSIISNVPITYEGLDTTVTQLTLSSAVTIDTGSTINATYNNLGKLISGIEYPGVQISGIAFGQQPGYSMIGFDNGVFDNLQYDLDGTPILGDQVLDNIIRSNFADAALGTRPEDITVDGGQFIDTYSSHAPEELIPGIVFDTLSLKIYTQINLGTQVLGYRMFNNMLRQTSYIRIADVNTTELSLPLAYNDTTISVTDASVLTIPNTSAGIPGVLFIGAERITYYRSYRYDLEPWTRNVYYPITSVLSYGNIITFSSNVAVVPGDYIVQSQSGANAMVTAIGTDNTSIYVAYTDGNLFTLSSGTIDILNGANVANVTSTTITPITSEIAYFTNTSELPASTSFDYTKVSILPKLDTLGQIRRGTQGTSVAALYPVDTIVNDASIVQNVPGTESANITLAVDTAFNVAPTVTYLLGLSGNIRANIGDSISQDSTSASYRVIDTVTGPVNAVLVQALNIYNFRFANVVVNFGSNISANVGDVITQKSTGAELTVTGITSSSALMLAYNSPYRLSLRTDAVLINGIATSAQPTLSTISTTETTLSINGVSTSVYPTSMQTTGYVDVIGNIVVSANTTLVTSNVWYNVGSGIATDGTGFEGATTVPVLFLKDKVATFNAEYTASGQLGTEDAVNILVTEIDENPIYGG